MVFKGFPNWGQLYERTSDDRELVMTRRLVMTPSCGLCRRFIPAEGGEASESSGVYLRESELRYFDDGAIFTVLMRAGGYWLWRTGRRWESSCRCLGWKRIALAKKQAGGGRKGALKRSFISRYAGDKECG